MISVQITLGLASNKLRARFDFMLCHFVIQV